METTNSPRAYIEFSHTEGHPEWPFSALVKIHTETPVELLHQLHEAGADRIAVAHNHRNPARREVAIQVRFDLVGTKHGLPQVQRFLAACDKLGIEQDWAVYNPATYYTDLAHAEQHIA